MNILTIDPPKFQIGDVVQYEVRAKKDGVELAGYRKCAITTVSLLQAPSQTNRCYAYTVVDVENIWRGKNQQIVREDQLELWVDDTPEEPEEEPTDPVDPEEDPEEPTGPEEEPEEPVGEETP